MPELPEVETIRLQLDGALRGLRIIDVEVLKQKSFVGGIREIGEIRGRKVTGVQRRGKMILIELEGGLYLLIHLKLTGQLIYREGDGGFEGEEAKGPFAVRELPNKYTRVIISFDNGGKPALPRGRLYFNDLRIFGWMRVMGDLGEVGGLGVEPLSPEFTAEKLASILHSSGRPVKLVLMDQEKIAGIGNIYANEALFRAGILPAKPAKKLRNKEIEKLREAIVEVLSEALKYKGTSDRDEAYRQISGEKGEFQNHLQVYGRAGQECLQCGGIVRRISLGGRGTFFCEKCQK
jgi:formamidopyrimidine-DNA glycosylase